MKKINQRILDLWKKNIEYQELTKYYPLLYPEGEKRQIAFMGFNPSFSEDKMMPIGRKLGFFDDNKGLNTFFSYSRENSPQQAVKVQKFDEYAIENYHVYFNLLHKIAKDVKLELQHTDLFLIRDKKQKNVKKLLEIYPAFFQEQISIALEVVNSLEPKVVVVINAKASDLILDSWKSKLTYSENTGHHNISLNNGESIPIFFSGMLSGRRPLDKHSRKRLVWHIKRSISKNPNHLD